MSTAVFTSQNRLRVQWGAQARTRWWGGINRSGEPPRPGLRQQVFVLKDNFIEISFTYCVIHPFRVSHWMDFSVFTGMCRASLVNLRACHPLKRKLCTLSLAPQQPLVHVWAFHVNGHKRGLSWLASSTQRHVFKVHPYCTGVTP